MKTVTLGCRVPVEVKTELIKRASETNVSLASYVTQLIIQGDDIEVVEKMENGGAITTLAIVEVLQDNQAKQEEFFATLVFGANGGGKGNKIDRGLNAMNSYLHRIEKSNETLVTEIREMKESAETGNQDLIEVLEDLGKKLK